MSKFRKMTAVLLSVMIIVCMFAVPASAEDTDDFEGLSEYAEVGDTVSKVIGRKYAYDVGYYSDHMAYYKFELKSAGDLDLKINIDGADQVFVDLYRQDGNQARPQTAKYTSGKLFNSGSTVFCRWKDYSKVITGTIPYKGLKAGIYYLRFTGVSVESVDPSPYYSKTIRGGEYTGVIKATLSFTPTSSSSSGSSSSSSSSKTTGKLEYLSVTLKKGSTLSLGAVTTGSSDGITWSSSKKSVATVNSKGKITAKAAGNAIITAKLGSTSVKIKVVVTK